jgi:hypothetical protein
MEHQYPGAISGDENMLAELMLPDQAHVRNQDWTIFFLHKDTSGEKSAEVKEEKAKARLERRNRRKENQTSNDIESAEADVDSEGTAGDEYSDEEEDEEGVEGPPLIYVLNLVNTKHDTTVKRLVSIVLRRFGSTPSTLTVD